MVPPYEEGMSIASTIALSWLRAATLRLQGLRRQPRHGGDAERRYSRRDRSATHGRIKFATNVQVVKADARMTSTLLDIKA